MKKADRLKVVSTGTSAVSLVLGAAVTGGRTLAQAISEDAGQPNAIKVGDTNIAFVVTDNAGNWEAAYYTITSSTQIDQTQRKGSSNAGAAVTFNGQGLIVTNDVLAADLARMAFDRDVPFSQSVPLDQVGITWMAQQTVAAKYTFTPAAGAVKGAIATVRLKADGVTANAPDTSAFKTISGTAPYNNVTNAINTFEFSYDGYDYWVACSQEGSTSAGADTTAPVLSSPSASSTGTTTGSGSVTTNEGNGTLYALATTNSTETAATIKASSLTQAISSAGAKAVNFTGLSASTTYYAHYVHVDAAGNTSNVVDSTGFTTAAAGDMTPPTLSSPVGTQTGQSTATATVSTNEANGTLYYMVSTNTTETATTVKAGSSQAVTATGTQNVSFSGLTAGTTYYSHFLHRDAAGNDSTVANGPGFTTAAATAPGAPTIGTATAGDSSATVTWAAPASNGGSAITGYTITASPGGATGSAAAGATSGAVTGLTNGTAYTFTVHTNNAVGASAESAASNSVTPASISYPRLTSLSATTTESGTGPYTYTGGGAALASETGGISSKSLPANQDGWVEFIVTVPNEVIVGFRLLNTAGTYSNMTYSFYASGVNGAVPAGYRYTGSGVLSATPQAGDRIRVIRTGNIWKFAVARAATPTTFVDVAGSSLDRGSAPQVWLDAVCSGSAAVQLTAWSGFV
jgi:hypothetical protein